MSDTCTLVAHFTDASGEPFQGVYAKFTPTRDVEAIKSGLVAVREVSASSDEEGNLELTLLQGLTGTLSITGIGIVRKVTVPTQDTCSLEDLIDVDGDSPFQVQAPVFVELPRSSRD